MARVTTRRGSDRKIEASDITNSFEFELRKVAIFHNTPLTVYIPSLELPITVGSGLGGIHWSLFARGEGCTACGNCCMNPHRRVWYWHEYDPRPDGLNTFDAIINGKRVTYFYHMQQDPGYTTACDYLDPYFVDGVQQKDIFGNLMHICTLHGDENPMNHQESVGLRDPDIKPLHCSLSPFVMVREVSYNNEKRPVLSRRLPARNWRWPKCPIDLNKISLTHQIAAMDGRNLRRLLEEYRHLPGSRMEEAIRLWADEADRVIEGNQHPRTLWLFELLKD